MQASPPLTLAAVEREFAEWRRCRHPRHTPSPLKAHAVALLSEHGISQICQHIGINHGTRGHQPHPMPKRAEHPRPVMRSTTHLHPDRTGMAAAPHRR